MKPKAMRSPPGETSTVPTGLTPPATRRTVSVRTPNWRRRAMIWSPLCTSKFHLNEISAMLEYDVVTYYCNCLPPSWQTYPPSNRVNLRNLIWLHVFTRKLVESQGLLYILWYDYFVYTEKTTRLIKFKILKEF